MKPSGSIRQSTQRKRAPRAPSDPGSHPAASQIVAVTGILTCIAGRMIRRTVQRIHLQAGVICQHPGIRRGDFAQRFSLGCAFAAKLSPLPQHGAFRHTAWPNRPQPRPSNRDSNSSILRVARDNQFGHHFLQISTHEQVRSKAACRTSLSGFAASICSVCRGRPIPPMRIAHILGGNVMKQIINRSAQSVRSTDRSLQRTP